MPTTKTMVTLGGLVLLTYLVSVVLVMDTTTVHLTRWFGALVTMLNWQPFGDHGVNHIASVRMAHILGAFVIYRFMVKDLLKRF